MLTNPGGVEDCCLLVQVSKADTTELPKPSVLQWAGSSLKTITKKLRKTSVPQPGYDSQLPMQQDASAPEAAPASLPAPASSDLIQGPPARLQPLQIPVQAAHHEHCAEKAVVSPACPPTPHCLLLVQTFPAYLHQTCNLYSCRIAELEATAHCHWLQPAELGAGAIAGGNGHA